MLSFADLASTPTRLHKAGENDIPYDIFADPIHPTNWPAWKRHAQLVTLSWMAFTANYVGGAHLTLFGPMSQYYGVTVAAIANSIGIMILGLGVGSFLWNPLAGAIGRRPTYIVSWVLFLGFTFWLAFSPTFNSFAAARFFAGFAGSVVQCLPVASITEMYRPAWRGTAIAFWSLFLILGPPTAPIIGSAVTLVNKWQYVYYVCLIFSGLALIMIIFLCHETFYIPPSQEELRAAMGVTNNGRYTIGVGTGSSDRDREKGVELHADSHDESTTGDPPRVSGRIGMLYNPLRQPKRFTIAVLLPLRMMGYLNETLPALYGAIIFGWAVGLTILLPQILEEPPYSFTGMLVACAYIPAIIGSVLGKLYGGYGSDWTMAFLARRNGGVREAEHRLWNCIPPVFLLFIGIMVFGFGFGSYMAWWVPLVFGVGIFYIGMVALTGALQAYMNDCCPQVGIASIQVYNFFKTTFSFGVPFFIADLVGLESWTEGRGLWMKKGNGAEAVIALALGLLLTVGLILFGRRLRGLQALESK